VKQQGTIWPQKLKGPTATKATVRQAFGVGWDIVNEGLREMLMNGVKRQQLQMGSNVQAKSGKKTPCNTSVRSAVFAFAVLCILMAGAEAADEQTRPVLLLNSYHKGYDWTDQITAAVEDEFARSGLPVELYVEYMDTKRDTPALLGNTHDDAWMYLRQLYRSKYHHRRFDVIISADDMALSFLLEFRDELFPHAPVVFCGMQDRDASLRDGNNLITGVLERYDFESTMKLAVGLHHSATQIVVVTERSETEPYFQRTFASVVPKLERPFKLVCFCTRTDLTMAELTEKIEKLGDESIVLVEGALTDRVGRFYTLEEIAAMLAARCKAPVYATWSQWLGLGVVGGRMANGKFQGQAAAEMAIRILKGESADEIAILAEGPDKYMFDYVQLKRFGISEAALPEGSDIRNEPPSFYHIYKEHIWTAAAVMAALTVITIILAISNVQRMRAEKALRRSQELFYAFMDQMPATGFMKDQEHRMQYVNQYMKELLGADKWIGKTVRDYYPAEVAEGVLAHDERVLAEGPSAREEWVPDKNGNWRCMHVYKFPIRREGEPVIIGGMALDITERKHAEEALEESHRQQNAILNTIPDIAWLKDKGSIYVAVNEPFAKFCGMGAQDLVGKTDFDAWPKDLAEKYRADDKEVMRSGRQKKLEEPLELKDGTRILLETIKTPIFDEQGGVVGISGIARDITERKKLEDELRSAEARYRTLVEQIPAVTYTAALDPASTTLYVSPQIESLIGFSSDEYKTDPDIWRKHLHPDDQPRVLEALGRTHETGETFRCEYRMTARDGRTVWFRDEAVVVKNSNGKPLFLQGVMFDITERKQAEAELEQYRQKIARAERLASLGTLSATLAHELNQPLTVIRLSVENAMADLEKTTDAGSIVEELKDGLEEVSNAASIVERFRRFAKKSSKKLITEVDLKATAERIFAVFQESARRAKITLRLEDMERLPRLRCNEKDMEQLFFALTENAIQAALPPRLAPAVSCEAREGAEAGDGKGRRPPGASCGRMHQFTISGEVKTENIELRFSDDCCGIAEEDLGRIFEPFFSTGPEGTRTGLGLCIVQRIVSECGGKIRVQSKPGKGTTFYVTLPAAASCDASRSGKPIHPDLAT
jgi:PAS domain S-box-containing protein